MPLQDSVSGGKELREHVSSGRESMAFSEKVRNISTSGVSAGQE